MKASKRDAVGPDKLLEMTTTAFYRMSSEEAGILRIQNSWLWLRITKLAMSSQDTVAGNNHVLSPYDVSFEKDYV